MFPGLLALVFDLFEYVVLLESALLPANPFLALLYPAPRTEKLFVGLVPVIVTKIKINK